MWNFNIACHLKQEKNMSYLVNQHKHTINFNGKLAGLQITSDKYSFLQFKVKADYNLGENSLANAGDFAFGTGYHARNTMSQYEDFGKNKIYQDGNPWTPPSYFDDSDFAK